MAQKLSPSEASGSGEIPLGARRPGRPTIGRGAAVAFFLAACSCVTTAISQAGPAATAGAPSLDGMWIGSHRLTGGDRNVVRSLVVLIDGEPAADREVSLHPQGELPVPATVLEHGSFLFLQRDPVPCGFLKVEAGGGRLPEFFLVTSSGDRFRGSEITEITSPLPDRILRSLHDTTSRFVMLKMRRPRVDGDRVWKAEELAGKDFSEQHAYRRFFVSAGKDLVLVATKIVDLPAEADEMHIWQTAYHRHEVVGFLLSPTGEVETTFFDVGSLSWAGGDGTGLFKQWTPREYLDDLVLGVYDVEPDGNLEILVHRQGTESSRISIKRLRSDGKVVDTGVELAAGL